jgi:hypothetical protein
MIFIGCDGSKANEADANSFKVSVQAAKRKVWIII